MLVLSVCGDGKSYTLLVETDPSEDDPKCRQYFSRFPTRLGYSRVGGLTPNIDCIRTKILNSHIRLGLNF